MAYLGEYSINDYLWFPAIAHNTSGSAANLDSGTFSIDFYENDLGAAGNAAAMTTPDTTFSTQIDSKTGFYGVKIQLTAANGFEAGKQYIALIHSGTVDSQTPAAIWVFKVVADGADQSTVNSLIVLALPNVAAGANGGLPLGDANGRVDISKIEGNTTIDGLSLTNTLRNILCVADQDATRSSGTITYKNQSGTTISTHVISTTGREVTRA